MAFVVDAAKAVAVAIVPPKPGASDEAIYRWRLAIAGGVLFLSGSVTTHIALACGFLPAFFPGFARAGEVSDIKQTLVAMRADTLRGQIVEAVKDQCAAKDQKNFAAERAATDRKYGRIDEYRKVTGHDPDVPQCWEVP